MRVKSRGLGRDRSIETPTFFTTHQYTQITHSYLTSQNNSTFPLSIVNNLDFKIGHSTGCLKKQEVSIEAKSNKHLCPAWRDPRFTNTLSNMKNRDNHDKITLIDSFVERVRRYKHGKFMG